MGGGGVVGVGGGVGGGVVRVLVVVLVLVLVLVLMLVLVLVLVLMESRHERTEVTEFTAPLLGSLSLSLSDLWFRFCAP